LSAEACRAAALLCCAGVLCLGADLQEIVQRATAAINSDWASDPKYACVEKDETTKGGKTTRKTFQVVMIDGSEYHLDLPIDEAGLLKLKNEVERRRNESPEARQKRIDAWKKQHDENGEFLLDFPKVFDFQLVREDVRDGRPAYVLTAQPKPGYVATTRAAKVLLGMTGTAWVDKETLHPMHVECTVMKPVPVYGPLASVLPGTKIDIGMTRVTDAVWLIDEVRMRLAVAKLHFFKSDESTLSTYTEYRPNEVVLQELLSKAAKP
jgi:hypothetical protein